MKNWRISEQVYKIYAFFFPDLCVICRRNTVKEGAYVCRSCAESLAAQQGKLCPKCAQTPRLCQCTKPEKAHSISSVFWYSGDVRKYVLYMKNNRVKSQYEYAAQRMSKLILESKELSSCDCVTYIPRSRDRQRALGIDHAKELARLISEKTGMPLLHSLVAPKKLAEQKRLDAKERSKNVRGAFSLAKDENAPRGKMLLIDDVLTTGATAKEGVKTLLSGGAKEVCLMFLAKTR